MSDSKQKVFKKEDVQAAIWQNTDESSPLVLEYAGKWVDEGKYQYQQIVLKETSTGVFYCYGHSKSGSHFTDYSFGIEYEPDMIELYTVVKTTRVIEVWE